MHLRIVWVGLCLTACAHEASPAVISAPPSPALIGEEHDALFRDVRYRDGTLLPETRIHYAVAGTPHRDANGQIDNAVLVLHWTGASSDVMRSKAFVDSLFAAGKPIDLARYYVVFIDAIGHGRSSKPSDGLRAKFPAYGYEDMVTLQYRVITETLGLTHLHAIVGSSMGGMNAWQWAERYPDFMDAIIPVVALPKPIAGRNLLWRRWISRQIRNDPSWQNGDYTKPPRGWVEANTIMRMMLDGVPHLDATVTTPESAKTFIDASMAQAQKVDANDLLFAIESSTDYDPTAGLANVRTRVFALNFDDDEFNPTELGVLQETMKRVPRGAYVIQPGSAASFGHATQAHPELWGAQIGRFLAALEGRDTVTP